MEYFSSASVDGGKLAKCLKASPVHRLGSFASPQKTAIVDEVRGVTDKSQFPVATPKVVVAADDLKLALCLAATDPAIGGDDQPARARSIWPCRVALRSVRRHR